RADLAVGAGVRERVTGAAGLGEELFALGQRGAAGGCSTLLGAAGRLASGCSAAPGGGSGSAGGRGPAGGGRCGRSTTGSGRGPVFLDDDRRYAEPEADDHGTDDKRGRGQPA